jgi:hypothetical protein
VTAPERPGPERPGPDYPPEWDDEPSEWEWGDEDPNELVLHVLEVPDHVTKSRASEVTQRESRHVDTSEHLTRRGSDSANVQVRRVSESLEDDHARTRQ